METGREGEKEGRKGPKSLERVKICLSWKLVAVVGIRGWRRLDYHLRPTRDSTAKGEISL